MSAITKLVDKSEAARQIGGSKPVSISFINTLLAKGLLARVRLSYKATRIPQESVTAYIQSRTEVAR